MDSYHLPYTLVKTPSNEYLITDDPEWYQYGTFISAHKTYHEALDKRDELSRGD